MTAAADTVVADTVVGDMAASVPSPLHLAAAVAIMALLTFALRAAPFLLLARAGDSPLVRYVGRVLPPGIMVILVVYALRGTAVTEPPYGVPAFAAVAVTAALHLTVRNALAGIVAGTGCYMVLTALLA